MPNILAELVVDLGLTHEGWKHSMNELLLMYSLLWSTTSVAETARSLASAPRPVTATAAAAVMPAKKHTILFFTASWCPACLRMKVETLPGVLLPGHDLRLIDTDTNPQLAAAYGVQSLPAYVVLDSLGRAYRHGVGFRDVQEFVSFLNGR
jgi:thiol-disulfide isomerase/thioredoxin